MRVSTQQIYTTNLDNLNRLNESIAKTQQQISSGERFSQPSEDPLAAGQVLKLDKELARTEQFQDNIDVTERRLELEETTLDSVNNATIRLQELATQAGNGTLSDDDLALIAAEVDEIIGEIDGLVNTKDVQGEYLFSGYQGLTRTYDYNEDTGEYEFQGDGGQRYIQVGPDFQVASTDSGLSVFEGAQGAFLPSVTDGTNDQSSVITPYVSDFTEFEEFYDEHGDLTLDITGGTLTATDSNGDPVTFYTDDYPDGVTSLSVADGDSVTLGGMELVIQDASDTSLTLSGEQEYDNILNYALEFKNALENSDLSSDEGKLELGQSIAEALLSFESVQEQNIGARASIGARINAIDDQKTINDDYILYTQTARSELIDTDLSEAATQLTLQQTALEAAYASFNVISGLSLFDYIR